MTQSCLARPTKIALDGELKHWLKVATPTKRFVRNKRARTRIASSLGMQYEWTEKDGEYEKG